MIYYSLYYLSNEPSIFFFAIRIIEQKPAVDRVNQIDIFYTDVDTGGVDDRLQARLRKVQTKRNWAALRKKLVADDPKSEGGNPEMSKDNPA